MADKGRIGVSVHDATMVHHAVHSQNDLVIRQRLLEARANNADLDGYAAEAALLDLMPTVGEIILRGAAKNKQKSVYLVQVGKADFNRYHQQGAPSAPSIADQPVLMQMLYRLLDDEGFAPRIVWMWYESPQYSGGRFVLTANY